MGRCILMYIYDRLQLIKKLDWLSLTHTPVKEQQFMSSYVILF